MQTIDVPVAELRTEHDSLVSLLNSLNTSDLDRMSYASEWTIAQVLSHLGSGAEINLSNLRGALGTSEPISKDTYPQLWERWDSLTPIDQGSQFEQMHGELVAALEDVEAGRLAGLQIPTAMGTLSGKTVVGMRLREAAIHAWDVAVALDGGAVLREETAGILADQLPDIMKRAADGPAATALDLDRVDIVASHPEKSFQLHLSDPATLSAAADAPTSAVLRLPTEALVRLVYGRLDPEHQPDSVEERPDGLLARLRTVFTGF